MNLKKIGAVAASALVMASLAVSASASELPGASDTGIASVKAADVDLSGIDWDSLPEGELIVLGPVDITLEDGSTVTCGLAATAEAAAASLEECDVDLTNLEGVQWFFGEPEALGEIDPGTVAVHYTAAAAEK